MFAFFRTNQKFIYIFVTAIIIITFSFFGTQGSMENGSKRIKDKVISKTLDGKNIKQSEVDALSFFLSKDEEIASKLNIQTSVINKDFIETKLATTLIKNYFDVFKAEYQEKLEKAKKFSSYTHPQVPFISAKNIWSQFAPNIISNIEVVQKKSEFDLATFDLFCELYSSQQKFSPEMLKRMLLYQQNQYDWIKPDPKVQHDNMALFGFNTASDWFGEGFVDLLSQVILNISAVAEDKGYKITTDAVLADLMKMAKDRFGKTEEGKTVSNNVDYFRYQQSICGMNEKMMVDVWKKVLLFRKYMNDVGDSVILDDFCPDKMASLKKEKAKLQQYKLSPDLQINNFASFMKLQVYLEAVFGKKNGIELPTNELSAIDIEKKYPELIEQKYEIEMKHVTINDLGMKIGEKKLWTWQIEDNNYEMLKQEFIQLSNLSDKKEERFSNLSSVDANTRKDIDAFSRKNMLISDKVAILEALEKADSKSQIIGLKSKSIGSALLGVNDTRLSSELLKAEVNLDKNIVDKQSALFCYSDNNEDFYQINVLAKPEKKTVVSLKEALSGDILETLLDDKLMGEYIAFSNVDLAQFKDEKGSLKPFYDVKDQVGGIAFKNILDEINERKKISNIEETSLDSYATYFVYFNLLDIREKLKSNNFDGDSLSPWKMDEKEIMVTRLSTDQWLKDLLFNNDNPPTWSDVNINKNEIAFYKFINKETDEKATSEEIAKTKKILSDEAKRSAFDNILSELNKKEIIKLQLERKEG